MSKVYLFTRKKREKYTAILETSMKNAIEVLKENRNIDYQLGILNAPSYDSMCKVYGEYAPFRKVDDIRQLIGNTEKIYS